MENLPWYKDGLRFKCTECGKCCTGGPGFVWIIEEEMQAIADSLKISLQQFKKEYIRMRDNRYSLIEIKRKHGGYDCVFLKDKKCLVYENRPKQCRTYPWWKENLNTEESWKLAAKECEGINDEAEVVPYSQIVQLLSRNSNQSE